MGCAEAIDAKVQGDKLVILFDLNGVFLFRPWVPPGSNGFVVAGPHVPCVTMPLGPSKKEVRLYLRPHARQLLASLPGRCSWGFITSSTRSNAVREIREIFRHSLDMHVIDSGGAKLKIVPSDASVYHWKDDVWLFDSSH